MVDYVYMREVMKNAYESDCIAEPLGSCTLIRELVDYAYLDDLEIMYLAEGVCYVTQQSEKSTKQNSAE